MACFQIRLGSSTKGSCGRSSSRLARVWCTDYEELCLLLDSAGRRDMILSMFGVVLSGYSAQTGVCLSTLSCTEEP